MHPLLRDGIIADSEATSLRTGAGVLEFAFFDINTRKAEEFILEPNLVKLKNTISQDPTKLASGPLEKYENVVVRTWREAIAREQLDMLGIEATGTQRELIARARTILPWNNEFLHKAIAEGRLPQVTGAAVDHAARIAELQKFGVDFTPGKSPISMRTLLEDIIPSRTKGKTVWFANAPYDSRIIGAHAGALGLGDAVKKNLETQKPGSPAPFYVTGKEVIAARTAANLTGDWRQVWKAYKQFTPKAGETAVRDILDVVRATVSYGQELGYLKKGVTFHGLGIDLTSKMYARAFGDTQIQALTEQHRALEDSAIHQMYVLERSTQIADVLQEVTEGTARGGHYVRMAQRGQGPLYNVLRVFKMQEQVQERLHKKSLIQRLGRAYENFMLDREITHTTGGYKIITQDQIDYSGNAIKAVMNFPDRKKHTSMQNFLDWLKQQDDVRTYGFDVEKEYRTMIDYARSADVAAVEGVSSEYIGVKKYVEAQRALLDADISSISMEPDRSRVGGMARRPSAARRAGVESIGLALPKVSAKTIRRVGIMGAAASMASIAWDAAADIRREKQNNSVLTYDYQAYLDQMEGMPEVGIAGSTRSANTDFGSPYRGPTVSQQVLLHQDLLEERERFLAKEYHIRHYDPQVGLFGLGSVFRFKSGYSYFGAGEAVQAGYRGMQGQNMMSLNLKDGWKITAEDADTVVLRKRGLINAITNFFGLDQPVRVRLAGIDSPELGHGSRTFGGAQPYAEQAKQVIAEKIANAEDVEIVYSTRDTSYGRMMGAVFTDGKNLNYELVREGAAAHLPYGKSSESMISYEELRDIEKAAFQAKRGFWGTDYGQMFYQITEAAGHRPTLNTLANKARIVENDSYMELVSALETTRRLGTLPANWGDVVTGVASHYDPFKDNVKPEYFNAPARSYKNALHTMQMEVAGMTRTSMRNPNKSPVDRVRPRLNQHLALDSLGTTNSPYTRRRSAFNETYAVDKIRNKRMRLAMAENQAATMQDMFSSQIGHHRML